MTEQEIYLNKHDTYIGLLKHDLKMENKEITKSIHEICAPCTTEREYKRAQKLLDKLDGIKNKKVISRSIYYRGYSIS